MIELFVRFNFGTLPSSTVGFYYNNIKTSKDLFQNKNQFAATNPCFINFLLRQAKRKYLFLGSKLRPKISKTSFRSNIMLHSAFETPLENFGKN